MGLYLVLLSLCLQPDATEFTDYIFNIYISEDSKFLPVIWVEEQFFYSRTTNDPESVHSNYNHQFYKQHPKKETEEKQKFVQKCWETSEVEKIYLNNA